MIGERLYQIRELFEAALERDPGSRLQFLEQACLGDAELLGEVQKLVEADKQGDTVLDDLLGAQEVLTRFPPPLPIEGRRIGPYRIEREIGRGGMGIVYLASRADGAFRKQFAFKVVQYSLTSDELLVRFRREREILGSLDHANIARLVDAGATEEGLPYYVMEYIEGQPIDRYCDEQRLNITQRTNLFRAVCQAVQYAHQNLVVHRDLKPSNILVTTGGTVKLLDFGIAKFLDDHRQEAVFAATVLGMRLMTPEYASPEQIRGEPIATASDVYTLGVILYELLTGHKPYRLKSGMLHEVERAICEEEPTRPSTVIVRNDQAASLPSTADEISALREGSIARLRRRLSGDLDNILLMALRKEPGRRYPSAEQLDADLGRHLDNLPVIARQDTVLYRTQKFLLRHKLPVAAAAAFLLFLIGGLVITIQLYLNATRAQSVAVHQSRVADAERERAQLQTVLAEREKNNAKHAAEKAQKAQLQAEAERRHALQAAAEARARQLAAQSESLYTQPGRLTLASLLGIESVRRVPLVENRSFLASALALAGRPRAIMEHSGVVNAVAISRDGTWLATASDDKTIRIWDAQTGRERARLQLEDKVRSVAIGPEGSWLATASDDQTARIWDAQTGRELTRLQHQDRVRSVAISPDGKWLATASNDQTARIWDAQTGRERARLQHQDKVRSVAISPDGKWLATASNDQTARIWDAQTGRERARLQHLDAVTAVAISPDGTWLATASDDKAARIWDAQTGRERARLEHSVAVTAVAISHDGTWLATADYDRNARIWDAQTGRERGRLEHLDAVTAVAISPDGTWLATASNDKTARIWDAQPGRERARLQVAHAVNTVAINPDSKWLATGSNEHVERLSDAQGSHEFLRIQFSDDPEAVIFTSKASLLVAHGKSVTLEPWRTEDLVHDLCARLNRNLTRGEWKQYLGNEPYQQTCPHLPAHNFPKGTRSE